ncbi:MAG TPA: hypothetical protein PLK80_19020, partial [bacterium]|nr:hypothetical protein [bacterium]
MSPDRIQEILQAAERVESAPHGERSAAMAVEAAKLKMSPRNLSRNIAKLRGRKRALRSDYKADKRENELVEYTKVACEYQKLIAMTGEKKRVLPLESA